MDTPREPLWIEGDPGMIEQVVTNLCVNARDAMPSGGRLTIVTRAQTLDADAVKGRGSAQPGRFVCLGVEDTGFGMEPAVMEHLFEPFFTTKPQGKGTGLGLATVHGIVAKHMGFVTVESQVGKGSTFRVFLPRAEAPDVHARSNPLVSVRGGTERIMVVEDELAVRTVAVRCLRKLGYHVTEAEHGPDALAIWKREGGAFDLLFTDMVMPEGISGAELCSRLREDAAGLRTIITSGYSAEIVDLERLAGSGVMYLAKPYDVATLASTVRDCLDGPA